MSYLVSIVSNEEFEIMSLNQLGHYSYESQIETHKTQLTRFFTTSDQLLSYTFSGVRTIKTVFLGSVVGSVSSEKNGVTM